MRFVGDEVRGHCLPLPFAPIKREDTRLALVLFDNLGRSDEDSSHFGTLRFGAAIYFSAHNYVPDHEFVPVLQWCRPELLEIKRSRANNFLRRQTELLRKDE